MQNDLAISKTNSIIQQNPLQRRGAATTEQTAFSDVFTQALGGDGSTQATSEQAGEAMMMYMMMSGMGGMGSMMSVLMMTQLLQGDESLTNLLDRMNLQGGGNASIVEMAMSRLGDPYSQPRAGEEDYTDCSYLTRWCYRQTGVALPRTAAEQARYCVENGQTISREELQPGDLVFFSGKQNGRFMNITHVAVYAGNGKIVDASSSRGEVVYRDLFGGQVLYGRPR